MHEFMTGFRHLLNYGVNLLRDGNFKRVSSLLAVAGVAALATAFAADKNETSNSKGPTVEVPNHEQLAIPQDLKTLKLSAQQEEQIKGIIRSYEKSLSMVWKQFGNRSVQTIDLESQLLAALEDNLTEPQRLQVRNSRLKTANHEKAIESTNTKPNQATAKLANAVDDELAGVGVTLTSKQEAAAETVEEKYRVTVHGLTYYSPTNVFY